MSNEFDIFNTDFEELFSSFDSIVHSKLDLVAKFVGFDKINDYEIKKKKNDRFELLIRDQHNKIRYRKELTDEDIEELGEGNCYDHRFCEF